MKQRHALRLLLAAITVASAVASIVSGNLLIASGLIVCALTAHALPFAEKVSPDHVKTLLESLRISQKEGAPSVNAVAVSLMIFIRKSAISGGTTRGYVLLFRDEIEAAVWRELATLLRHQARPSPELKKVGQSTTFRLGKSSDL